MSQLFFPELFCQIVINLNDKEKIFLTSCSKILHNSKSLFILDSEYNLEEINNKWRVKNILIKNFSLKNKIKKLIRDLITESITVNSEYVRFISHNVNIKLFHNEEIIKKIVRCGNSYLAMKIMLNNNGSIDNLNRQFQRSARCGYLAVVKLLINLGADIHSNNDIAIITASYGGYLDIVKLLIELRVNINVHDSIALIDACRQGHLSVVKLLVESGANIHARNNLALRYAEINRYSDMIKLLKN